MACALRRGRLLLASWTSEWNTVSGASAISQGVPQYPRAILQQEAATSSCPYGRLFGGDSRHGSEGSPAGARVSPVTRSIFHAIRLRNRCSLVSDLTFTCILYVQLMNIQCSALLIQFDYKSSIVIPTRIVQQARPRQESPK